MFSNDDHLLNDHLLFQEDRISIYQYYNAFIRCSSLTHIAIPSSVSSFGHHLFGHIKSIDISGDIKQIPKCMFAGCPILT